MFYLVFSNYLTSVYLFTEKRTCIWNEKILHNTWSR